MLRLSAPTVIAIALAAAAARADTRNDTDIPHDPAAMRERLAIPTPLSAFTSRVRAAVSQTIYLERCRGGCTIRGSNINDVRTTPMLSTIPAPGADYSVNEYRNGAGQTGAMADAEWAAVVQCLKEVYSPFMVTVTDVRPAANISYHAAIIAGIPQNINFSNNILGVAPLSSDCSPQDNVISFSFANAHTQTELVSRVNNICWTAAQESAHAFGLDHEHSFVIDGRSACNDPMTYRTDCGGQKFFRNDVANCGEDEKRPCRCGSSQNSHLKLQAVFGPGTSIVPPPTSAITSPVAGGGFGTVVVGQAGSKRGVSKVELYLNDYKWAEAKGAVFGPSGQAVPSQYAVMVPATVPNSVIDIRLRAFDDLGNATDSAVVTVTKGAPCATADTCANGQKCENGRCFWDPPAGEIGDDCDYPQFCLSGVCHGSKEKQICTQECIPGVSDSCPDGFTCQDIGSGKGVCFFPEGGCCSVAPESGLPWPKLAFAALVLGLVLWPRRRSR